MPRENITYTEQAVRIIIGFLLLTLALFGPRIPLGWLGLPAILTGLTGYCPLTALVERGSRHAS
ncbi:DUF2892 domain-containing protein [Novosphingobium tardum]|uniref:DUF2892 domain-containing protein n=1 Tax=Novosphingobium tardum TaxID=1538021 RepID=A0ABV8RJL9_9SPHN